VGIFISLIISVANIIQILFTAIERKFTDVLEAGMYVDMYGSDMRLAIASLVVMFPIYLLLSMYVSRDIMQSSTTSVISDPKDFHLYDALCNCVHALGFACSNYLLLPRR
jgi:hypothetical protein